ncbi:MAG: hypothetical protein U5R48_08035 [Gammaproteobacteria bacterium]|nr:hypothetical protein [Gammaproteobacteria bacterium]
MQKVETFVDEQGEQERRLVDCGDAWFRVTSFATRSRSPISEETVDAGSIVITNPVPNSTLYLEGSAGGSGADACSPWTAGRPGARPTKLVITGEDGESRVGRTRGLHPHPLDLRACARDREESSVFFRVRLR